MLKIFDMMNISRNRIACLRRLSKFATPQHLVVGNFFSLRPSRIPKGHSADSIFLYNSKRFQDLRVLRLRNMQWPLIDLPKSSFPNPVCFRIITYLDVTPRILFFLHGGYDYGAEALRGHGGLNDVGVLPAGFV